MEADAIVGRALEFAFHFARTELDHEYMTYGEIKDGTYATLLASNGHFADAVANRSKQVKLADEHEPLVCTFCRAKAVDPVTLGCRMCGHWEVAKRPVDKGFAFEDLDDDVPF
jgi:hypothetical protein